LIAHFGGQLSQEELEKGDKSTDPGMTKCVMLIVKKSTTFQFPMILGEDTSMSYPSMGALHIEDKAQLMLGKFIRGSEWEWTMTTAALDEHHTKRTH
jgi:hypothetical protein